MLHVVFIARRGCCASTRLFRRSNRGRRIAENHPERKTLSRARLKLNASTFEAEKSKQHVAFLGAVTKSVRFSVVILIECVTSEADAYYYMLGGLSCG